MFPETPMASEALTNRIRVVVRSFYVAERSAPENDQYFFAYRITITNEGDQAATLLRRHWVITDALGNSEEVHGDGVVGEQPRLAPGEHFEYTSACPLETPYGTMRGVYHLVTDDGAAFTATINPFELYVPAMAN